MGKLTTKDKLIMVAIAILLFILGFLIDDSVTEVFNTTPHIEVVRTEGNCSNAKVYYHLDEFDIYTYCLDSVRINMDDGLIELKSMLESETAINEVFDSLKKKETYKDGGSELFVDDEHDIAVLKCNTTDGNKDIYIGNVEMGYEEGFCENSFSVITDTEFTMEYKVLGIYNSTDKDYKHVTLMVPGTDTVETVKVDASLLKNVKENTTYKFSFYTNEPSFRDTLKDVFHYSTVVSITPVNSKKK